MDRTSQVPDPERLIAYLRGEPATVASVLSSNPKLRDITHNATAHRLRMQHINVENADPHVVDYATSEAFSATMLLSMLYNNEERILLVDTLGEALLSESSTSFIPVARPLIDCIAPGRLAASVRAHMDTHLLCSFGNQMRDPYSYVRVLAALLVREKQYVDQATNEAMRHHRFVGDRTFH